MKSYLLIVVSLGKSFSFLTSTPITLKERKENKYPSSVFYIKVEGKRNRFFWYPIILEWCAVSKKWLKLNLQDKTMDQRQVKDVKILPSVRFMMKAIGMQVDEIETDFTVIRVFLPYLLRFVNLGILAGLFIAQVRKINNMISFWSNEIENYFFYLHFTFTYHLILLFFSLLLDGLRVSILWHWIGWQGLCNGYCNVLRFHCNHLHQILFLDEESTYYKVFGAHIEPLHKWK